MKNKSTKLLKLVNSVSDEDLGNLGASPTVVAGVVDPSKEDDDYEDDLTLEEIAAKLSKKFKLKRR